VFLLPVVIAVGVVGVEVVSLTRAERADHRTIGLLAGQLKAQESRLSTAASGASSALSQAQGSTNDATSGSCDRQVAQRHIDQLTGAQHADTERAAFYGYLITLLKVACGMDDASGA
jgi:hypothetical protein